LSSICGRHDDGTRILSYEAAAAGLAEDQSNFDDARCDLAMVEAKIGGVLRKLGKTREAAAHYEKDLDTAKLSVSLEHNDFPALYAAAEANAGAGDLAASEARKMADPAARSKLWNDACASYENSLSIWKRISNPSRFDGNGYLSSDPREIAQRLAACKAELVRGASA
jgi:hypothetical protein